MSNNKHLIIMGRIILLFGMVMLMSFTPEVFPEFFGDFSCEGSTLVDRGNWIERRGCNLGFDSHTPKTHWGFRHWIWMSMGLTLFIYNAILIGNKIENNEQQ